MDYLDSCLGFDFANSVFRLVCVFQPKSRPMKPQTWYVHFTHFVFLMILEYIRVCALSVSHLYFLTPFFAVLLLWLHREYYLWPFIISLRTDAITFTTESTCLRVSYDCFFAGTHRSPWRDWWTRAQGVCVLTVTHWESIITYQCISPPVYKICLHLLIISAPRFCPWTVTYSRSQMHVPWLMFLLCLDRGNLVDKDFQERKEILGTR